MNRTTSSEDALDDGSIRSLISAAGDPHVEPRPEHVEQVRDLLLDRLAAPRRATASHSLRLAPWLIAASILIAALVGTVPLLTRPANAWAQIAQALQEKPWIHVVTRESDRVLVESWISPRFQIVAFKYDHGPEHHGAEYHDLKTRIKAQYIAGENTVYRLPEGGESKYHVHELVLFQQFLRGEIFAVSPIPDTEIVEQKTRDVVEQGRKWKEYELTVREKTGRAAQQRMWLRVDPQTGLPRTWDIDSGGGKLQQTLEYPEAGPADILALGIPATARWVDRIPSDDLERVLAGLKVGRNRFDDYCEYVVYLNDVWRVWHKGRKWRVETVNLRLPTKATLVDFGKTPEDADFTWFKSREQDFVFNPQAICDGQTMWFYRYKPEPIVPDRPFSLKLESVDAQSVSGSADDSLMPWPHLLPEQLGHPSVYLPDAEREFVLEPKPSDGPAKTVRLRVRDAQDNDPQRPDEYRLWIDPENNYLALRAEATVFDSSGPHSKSGRPTRIAYIDTKILQDLARSPSGFWYPRRVIRTTSGSKYEQVTRFFLDFHGEIPDMLFQPPK